MSEQWELLDLVYGAAVGANTETNLGYNDLGNYYRAAVIIHPVALNDALDVDIEQATDTSGTSAKSFDSAAKDVAVAATDTTPQFIEIRPEEFDIANKFDCLNVEVTTANTGGGSNYFVVELWAIPKFGPASTTNIDTVTD
jgi:hypothetical protein